MKRAFVPLALLAVAASAAAQSAYKPTGIQLRVGYGFTPSFDAGGDSRSPSGPEFAAAFPLGTFAGSGVLLEPSYYAAGRSHDGADVYRLTLFLHRTFAQGIAGRIGVGYSNSGRPHGVDYDGRSDLIFDIGVEYPLAFRRVQAVVPYVDVHGVIPAQHNQLAGVFVGLGVRI